MKIRRLEGDILYAKEMNELPAMQEISERLEELAEAKIVLVSVGAGRRNNSSGRSFSINKYLSFFLTHSNLLLRGHALNYLYSGC